MQASIVLYSPSGAFTNLDQISGKVLLRCGKSVDVDSIIVKLEGESRTRLLSPAGPSGEKAKPQLEYHKILYRAQRVFPSTDQMNQIRMSGQNYTLPSGNHEFPFRFQFPFNNACFDERNPMPNVSISGGGLEVAQPAPQHVKKTLPPTLSGFPGEGEIRYFLKCTVKRHAFWKENARAYAPFNFFPIEPPRPAVSGNEIFARQKQSFNQFPEGETAKSKVKGLFSKSKEPTSPTTSSEAPSISIDARLPEPPILTCAQGVPLRILLKKLNDCDSIVYLQSLQISLIGSTKFRAHNVYRTETNSWVLVSKSNMGMPIGAVSDAVDTENIIPDNLWRGQPLPNTVAPSFETCNISRAYQLDVRIGLSYSGTGLSSKVRKGQIPLIPQAVILPLRLDVQVYSGIAPPLELLEAMAKAKADVNQIAKPKPTDPTADKIKAEASDRKDSTLTIPPTPIDAPADPYAGLPAQQGSHAPAPSYDDAPPSYEDAVASNLPPIEAQRPEYAPPPAAEDEVLGRDEKKGSLFGRRDS